MTNEHGADAFWREGYSIVDALLTPQQCAFLRHCMDVSRRSGKMRDAVGNAYRGPNNEYSPVAGQQILAVLAPDISGIVGRSLVPTYSFWRIYQKGAVLDPHIDRNACEVSATIAIAADPAAYPWPICLTDLHGLDRCIALQPGAGLLYQGTKVRHWRAPLAGERQYQLFLHYVDAAGPLAALQNDQRQTEIP